MTKKYLVTYYGADGSGGTVANPPSLSGETFVGLRSARAAIKAALGGQTYGRWPGEAADGDVEAWHESRDEGCGGYAISLLATLH